METKKLLGGKLDKNITMGISWLIPIFGIVACIIDFKDLDLEEKRAFVSIFACCAIAFICACTIIGSVVSLAVSVCMIISAIKAFMGDYSFKVPGAYHIAAAIIK